MLNLRTRALQRATFTLLTIALAALLATGCGSVAGSHGIVPADAALVATFSLDSSKDGQWAQVQTVLRRVPSYNLVEKNVPGPQTVLNQLLLAGGGKADLKYARDVKPWLGKDGGVAGWLDKDLDQNNPVQWFAWLESSDVDKSAAALKKAFGSTQVKAHEGIDVHRGSGRSDDIYWAQLGEHVLIAVTRKAIHHAVDSHDGEAFDTTKRWKQLTAQRTGNESLASIIVTPELWKQAEAALKAKRLDGDLSKEEQKSFEQYEQLVAQYSKSVTAFAMHVGAEQEGFWTDVVVIGSEKAPGSGDTPARELLEQMPEGSLGALASASDELLRDETVESMRKQMQQSREQMELLGSTSAPGGKPAPDLKWLDDLYVAVDDLLAEDSIELLRDAYEGMGAGAIVGRAGGELAIVSSAPVKDPAAARQAWARSVQVINTFASKHSKVRVSSSDEKFTISGIPAQQLLASVPKAQQAKVRSNPLVKQFVRPELTGAIATDDERQSFAFPEWGMAPLVAALDGTATLADNAAYMKSIESADPPKDAVMLGWLDIAGLTRTIAEPIDGRVSFVIDGQLSHIGGPVFWATSEREGDETVTRVVIEVPVYE